MEEDENGPGGADWRATVEHWLPFMNLHGTVVIYPFRRICQTRARPPERASAGRAQKPGPPSTAAQIGL
jgi:hypothetical protein